MVKYYASVELVMIAKPYMAIADRIVELLEKYGDMPTPELLKQMQEDPSLIKYILGLLLRFELIEYEPHEDIIRLNKDLANLDDGLNRYRETA
jgi:hypothetical protein